MYPASFSESQQKKQEQTRLSVKIRAGVFPDSFISGNIVYNPGQFSETRFWMSDTELIPGSDTLFYCRIWFGV